MMLFASACTTTPDPSAPVSSLPQPSQAAPTGPLPSTGCPASAKLENHPGEGLPIQQGKASGATLYAMFFPDDGEVTTSGENKIIWRMTGTGAFSIEATGPEGRAVKPVWTEPHGGSSFRRPGEEWGTGWKFPVGGCWTFKATRTGASGELTVRVAG